MTLNTYLSSSSGEKILISEGELIVGRQSDCSIFIDKNGMSRQHAKFNRTGQQVWLTDLHSSNGTFINNNQLMPNTPQLLRNRDKISFSNNAIFTFCIDIMAENETVLPVQSRSSQVNDKFCPHCGTKNAVLAKFCGSCGKPIPINNITDNNIIVLPPSKKEEIIVAKPIKTQTCRYCSTEKLEISLKTCPQCEMPLDGSLKKQTFSTNIWDYLEKDMPYLPRRKDRDDLFPSEDNNFKSDKQVKIWDFFFRVDPNDVGKPHKNEVISLENYKREINQLYSKIDETNHKFRAYALGVLIGIIGITFLVSATGIMFSLYREITLARSWFQFIYITLIFLGFVWLGFRALDYLLQKTSHLTGSLASLHKIYQNFTLYLYNITGKNYGNLLLYGLDVLIGGATGVWFWQSRLISTVFFCTTPVIFLGLFFLVVYYFSTVNSYKYKLADNIKNLRVTIFKLHPSINKLSDIKPKIKEEYLIINETINELKLAIEQLKEQIPTPPSSEQINGWLKEDIKTLEKESADWVMAQDLINLADENGNPINNPLLFKNPGELQTNPPELYDSNKILMSNSSELTDIDRIRHLRTYRDEQAKIFFGVYYITYIYVGESKIAMASFFFDFIRNKVISKKVIEGYYTDITSIELSTEMRRLPRIPEKISIKESVNVSSTDDSGKVPEENKLPQESNNNHFKEKESFIEIEPGPTFTIRFASGEKHSITALSVEYLLKLAKETKKNNNEDPSKSEANQAEDFIKDAVIALRKCLHQYKYIKQDNTGVVS